MILRERRSRYDGTDYIIFEFERRGEKLALVYKNLKLGRKKFPISLLLSLGKRGIKARVGFRIVREYTYPFSSPIYKNSVVKQSWAWTKKSGLWKLG